MNKETFFANVQYDLRDNIPTTEVPPSAGVTFENYSDIEHFLERVLSTEEQDHILDASADLKDGRYVARIATGNTEDGTRHAHDFHIDKSSEGLKLLFVDPEHQLGKNKNRQTLFLPRKGDLRPNVCNLMGVKIDSNLGTPKLIILRYRSDAIDDRRQLKLGPQRHMLDEVLDRGELPVALKDQENEIIFYLQVGEDEVRVQSRYASESELNDLLLGERSSLAVEGKINSFKAVIKRFRSLLEERKFDLVLESEEVD